MLVIKNKLLTNSQNLKSMEFREVPSPLDVVEAWWVEVAKKCRNSVVFIDENFCESLHWCGGVSRLWKSDCHAVKSFSSFEKCEDDDDRGIFLISTVIDETPIQILRDIISTSNLHHVTVISAANKSLQSYSLQDKEEDENLVMAALERKILTWFKKENPVVEIFFFPILFLPIADDVFLMPKFREMYPIVESEIPFINENNLDSEGNQAVKKISNLSEVEFDHLPFVFRQEIKHLIGVFHSSFQVMNVREEIYSVGQTAAIIASELDSCMAAKLRRRTATDKISLVLIDRTMDLAGPMGSNDSSLYGKVMSALNNLPDHNIDQAINLAPLSPLQQSCEWTLIPGCFSHPEVECKHFMNAAVKQSSKKGDQFLTKTIKKKVEELGQESSNDILENVKILFKAESSLERNFGIIQQCLGVLAAENTPHNKKHQQNLDSYRRTLLQTVTDESTAPMLDLLELLSKRGEISFSLEDVLSIMLYIASIGGERVVDEAVYYKFVNAVSLAILDDKDELSPVLLDLVKGEIDDLSALKLANNLWNSFLNVATARNHLNEYRSILFNPSEAVPTEYRSFIVRLVNDCILKGVVNDLDYKSSGFKNMIKSGFSLFVNVSKPMPKEASMMIVYVVGGITTDEVREISEIVQQVKPNFRVVIGSSHFTKRFSAFTDVVQNNIFLKSIQ